jgi:hypothetical protein
MIGRRVGATLDGCVYSLVARIDRDTYISLEADAITPQAAFARSREPALVATAEGDGVSNLFDIDNYRHPDDIPNQYLPPQAYIEFAHDLPAAEH